MADAPLGADFQRKFPGRTTLSSPFCQNDLRYEFCLKGLRKPLWAVS